jgi:hypothetical protein
VCFLKFFLDRDPGAYTLGQFLVVLGVIALICLAKRGNHIAPLNLTLALAMSALSGRSW